MSSKAPVSSPEPQQPIVPQTPPLEVFLEANFRKIVIALIALIVVGLVYGAVSFQNRRTAEAAAIELTGAKKVEDYDLVVQKHPGTVAAGNALLAKAKLLWDDNKKDTSVATLRDFVSKYTDHPFRAQGMLGLATRLESMGGKNDIAEAKSLFEKLVSEQGKSDIGTLAQMRLGDLLWNDGKIDEAKKVYEALPQKMTGSPFFEHNTERLKWLAADLPTKEVEGPKPPPDSLKAPAPMNLNSGNAKSPLGGLMNNIKTSAPDAKIDVKPVAVPATPKPSVVTPGAALPLPAPGKVITPGSPSTTSAPVQVPAPPAAPKPATPAPAAPVPAPVTPAPEPAKPSAATPVPAPATPPPAVEPK